MGRFFIAAVLITTFAWLLPLAHAVPGTGGMRVQFEADSVYHHIVVAEDDEAR